MFFGQAQELFSELAYDFDRHLFYLEEPDEKQAYLGFGHVFDPISGADVQVAEKLNVLINQSFPDGAYIQFALYSSPDLHASLSRMVGLRDDQEGLTKEFILQKASYLNNAVQRPLDTSTSVKLRDIICILTVKVPCHSYPKEAEVEQTAKLASNTGQILKSIGAHAVPLDADTHIRILHTMFNWDKDAEWKSTAPGAHYDPTRMIRDQIMDYTSELSVKHDALKVRGKHVKVLSPKRYPEYVTIGMASQYAGDTRTGARGLRDPFLLTLTCYIASPEKLRQKNEQKRQWIAKQTHGPILDFVPHLVTQKQDMDCLFDALSKGDIPCRMMMSLAVFGDSEQAVEDAASSAKAYYQELGFTMLEDVHFMKPIFINMLPFGADYKIMRDISRYKTVASCHVARLAPIMGEWKGTGTPVMQFVSRTGQLMNCNLYDSGTNYNALIAAQSGSGKSFLTNDIIMSYLSLDATVWVIDVGRSYKKLCDVLGGVFMEFHNESNICLNPFDVVSNYNESSETLLSLLSTMATHKEELTDYQMSVLRKTLSEMWAKYGNALTIDIIEKTLLEHSDARVKDIGAQLYAFTSRGEYGKYFSGKNNTQLGNRFTVLELEELKGRKHLQQVVLLQLISQIQQEMYLGERGRPKVLIIDEAWDLFSNPLVAKFIEDTFRRVRKYGGATIAVTQSVNDVYSTPNGQAMAENSANMLLLKQKSEAIDNLRDNKRLGLTDAGYELLKSVHTTPGQYSEIMMITERGAGIGRLYVNRFTQLLYSTKAEEVQAINNIQQEMQCTMEQAINEYINRESGHV